MARPGQWLWAERHQGRCSEKLPGRKSFGFERGKTLSFWQELYEEGKEAYLENNYGDCVKLFEAALRDYKHYTQVLVRKWIDWCPKHKSLIQVECKSKCKASVKAESKIKLESPDMKHYHQLIQVSLPLPFKTRLNNYSPYTCRRPCVT